LSIFIRSSGRRFVITVYSSEIAAVITAKA
jgi:hypothetical protein